MRPFFFILLAANCAFAEPRNPDAKVVVMLDVNDTMLREVDRAYAGRDGVQSVVYRPTPGWRTRAVGINHEQKVGEGKVETTLGLRPGMEPFFERLGPLIARGKVRIVLASLDDPQRTKAIASQLKVGGKSLAEWGVETAYPEQFNEVLHVKEIGMLRRSLRLNGNTKVLAVDHDHTSFYDVSKRDAIVEVPAWTIPIADSHVDGLEVPNLTRHSRAFGYVADRVEAMVNAADKGATQCDWSAMVVPP